MTINFFFEFLTLADTQSFGTTAERHYISIATLNRHIHALEEHLGTVLIRRQGNKSILTDAGKSLIPYAKSIVSTWTDYSQLVASFRDQPHLNASIATNIPLSFFGITDLLESFQREHSVNRIDIRLTSFDQITKDLINEKIHFAICWRPETLSYRLAAKPLKSVEVFALLPETHPLADRSSIPLADLAQEPLLLLDDGADFHSSAIHLCREAGFSPIIRATALRGQSIEDLVLTGFGVGLLPMDSTACVRKGTVRIPTTPCKELALDILYNPAAKLNDCASSLMQYMCSSYSRSNDKNQ